MKWLMVILFLAGIVIGRDLPKAPSVDRLIQTVQKADDRDEARAKIYARNGIKASPEEGWIYERPIYAELYDVPLAFLEAVARAENGEVGYEMGQKSIHPAIKVLVPDGRLRQELQAARTLDRMAWLLLLEHPEYGEQFRKQKKRQDWNQAAFLLMYKQKYVEFMAGKWPDQKRDDPEAWRKNMSFFVHRWLKEAK